MPRRSTAQPVNDIMLQFEEYPIVAAMQGYVGLRLFPSLDVTEPSGRHDVIPVEQVKKAALTSADLARRDTGAYQTTDYKIEHVTFTTQEYGLNIGLDDRETTVLDNGNISLTAANIARIQLLDAMEKTIIDMAYNSSTYTGATLTAAVSASWKTAPTTATPLEDIVNAIEQVKTNTGVRPNTICMTWRDLMYFRGCTDVIDKIKYTSPAMRPEGVTAEDIANHFGVTKVIIADAFRNSGKIEAAATLSRFVPSGKIWVGITANEGDPGDVHCVGRTYHYTGDGSVITGLVESYRDESLRRDVTRIRHEWQSKIINVPSAFIITGAAA